MDYDICMNQHAVSVSARTLVENRKLYGNISFDMVDIPFSDAQIGSVRTWPDDC